VTTVGDWVLRGTGDIVAVDREDLDKSGKHPKYMLTFRVKPVELDIAAGATVPAEVPVRIKDSELARMSPVAPAVGDRVRLAAKASGPRPATFYLTSIERLGAAPR
jgi:hypothetical protein